jgi:putative membrane protein
MLGDELLQDRVEGRAAEAFVEEQVFATRARSGVLIFVALFEHRVVILADQGIDERVENDAWAAISDEVTAGVRHGRPAEALITAVQRCADLLVEHGMSPVDSENELPNEPRFRRE